MPIKITDLCTSTFYAIESKDYLFLHLLPYHKDNLAVEFGFSLRNPVVTASNINKYLITALSISKVYNQWYQFYDAIYSTYKTGSNIEYLFFESNQPGLFKLDHNNKEWSRLGNLSANANRRMSRVFYANDNYVLHGYLQWVNGSNGYRTYYFISTPTSFNTTAKGGWNWRLVGSQVTFVLPDDDTVFIPAYYRPTSSGHRRAQPELHKITLSTATATIAWSNPVDGDITRLGLMSDVWEEDDSNFYWYNPYPALINSKRCLRVSKVAISKSDGSVSEDLHIVNITDAPESQAIVLPDSGIEDEHTAVAYMQQCTIGSDTYIILTTVKYSPPNPERVGFHVMKRIDSSTWQYLDFYQLEEDRRYIACWPHPADSRKVVLRIKEGSTWVVEIWHLDIDAGGNPVWTRVYRNSDWYSYLGILENGYVIFDNADKELLLDKPTEPYRVRVLFEGSETPPEYNYVDSSIDSYIQVDCLDLNGNRVARYVRLDLLGNFRFSDGSKSKVIQTNTTDFVQLNITIDGPGMLTVRPTVL